MKNEEYYKHIENITLTLSSYRKKGLELSKQIIGETLYKEDLFFCSAANRCLALIDGLTMMINARNLTCVGALLRLQMDNCMRTYAAFIAENKDEVIDCILTGESIRNKRTNDGLKMSDKTLREKINEIDPLFSQVYEQASGYIHLSEKAFYQTVSFCDDNHLETVVGGSLPERWNDTLIEGAKAFIHFVKLNYQMLQAVADSKIRIDMDFSKEESEIV